MNKIFRLRYSPIQYYRVRFYMYRVHLVHEIRLFSHAKITINSNLGTISYVPRYGQFFVENAHFSYALLHSTQNLKMFPLH